MRRAKPRLDCPWVAESLRAERGSVKRRVSPPESLEMGVRDALLSPVLPITWMVPVPDLYPRPVAAACAFAPN